jgi:hypothetical protein
MQPKENKDVGHPLFLRPDVVLRNGENMVNAMIEPDRRENHIAPLFFFHQALENVAVYRPSMSESS